MNHDKADKGFFYSFIAVFLLSLSILTLEISFSHLFSATIQHHMIFAVIGSTLFGMGLGGFLSFALSRRWPTLLKLDAFFIVVGLAFSISVLAALYLVSNYSWSWYALIPIVILPFGIAGLLMSSIYTGFVHKSHLVYYGDLSGASLGCLLSIILLNGLGGPINTILTIAGAAIFIPLLFAWKAGNRLVIAAVSVLFVAVLALGLGNASLGIIELDYPEVAKDTILGRQLNSSRIIDTRWDAYSRVDLTKYKKRMDYARELYINGGTQATMVRFDERLPVSVTMADLQTLRLVLSYFPLRFEPKNEVLIIGSGGGKEVMMSVVAGVEHITAVEINPLVVQMTLDYSEYNGGVYRYRNVDVVVADGRSFLKRVRKKYDLIILPLAFSLAQAESGKLIYVEDYLHTLDAFRDYWESLTEGGRLVVIMPTQKLFSKTLSTGLAMLEEDGLTVEESLASVVALHDSLGEAYANLLMMKKGGYSPEEAAEVARQAAELQFDPIYLPYRRPAMTDISDLMTGRLSLKDWIEETPVNIKPATDDSPFFFKIKKGLPDGLQVFFWISVAMLLAFATLFILPHKKTESGGGRAGLIRFFVYFTSLGIGYMLVELSIAHRFVLYLGYPTLSLSVVLFSFLLSSGVGSLTGPYLFKGSLSRRAFIAGALVVAVLIIYYFVLSGILESTLIYSTGVKSLLAFLIIAPLGFFMGMPFPAGLHMLKNFHSEAVPWMWGINGVASFIGAMLTIMIAFRGGFHLNLLVSIIPYSVVAVIAYRSRDNILP
jgi:predicted membrane-bound spermidine synthase